MLPQRDDVLIERDLVITLSDGTRLSADLYRPSASQRCPVLVSYYPYRKDDVIGSLFEYTRVRLCERGYASLFVDMTGTGASDGDYGESFDLPTEGRDCAEAIEWAARQPWCDGNVGAWGVSYGGMSALAAAAHRPPHLKAIIAVYATTDMYQDTIAPGGCAAMLGRYAWAAHMVALGLCPPSFQDPGGRWRQVWHRRLQRLTAAEPHAVNWQAHPEPDAYWQRRIVDTTAITVPSMLISGWADAYSDAMIRVFQKVSAPSRIVIGPWMHVLPHLSDVEPYDWVSEMADWWDTHLRPDGTAQSADHHPVHFYARNSGWKAADNWPPAGTEPLTFFLDGYQLEPAPPAEQGSRSYQADPTVGITGGIWDPFGTGKGWPDEQSDDDARSLTFTSAPLKEQILITGMPEARLYLGLALASQANLVARLSMVGPDGRSALITTGRHRCPATAPDNDSEVSQPITISLGQTAFALPAGMRLRLSLACADFPDVWPSAILPDINVRFGDDQPSMLRIPISRATESTPAISVARPPAANDAGWVTDGQPRFTVLRDKVSDQATVTFGATTRLRTPSGAAMELDETFAAQVSAARPDGATVRAAVDVRLRMPAGEQIDVRVRSTSSQSVSTVDGSVALDGVSLLRHTWTGPALPRQPDEG